MTTTINSTVTGITESYKNALGSMVTKINDNDYVIKSNGIQLPTAALNNIEIDLSNLTKSGRKKIAKRINNYNKKNNLKTLNFLFHVMFKMNVIKDKVTIGLSHKEVEIQRLRKQYVKLRTELELARLAYVTEKGDFYK